MLVLEFVGSRPDRFDTHSPEMVFLNLFREYNIVNWPGVKAGDYCREIIKAAGLKETTDRDAYVIASMVQWLGTRAGLLFLGKVSTRNLATTGLALLPEVYAACWGEHIIRRDNVDGGYTPAELILNSKLDPDLGCHVPGDPSKIDSVSDRDLEVIGAIIRWLGTSEGQLFLEEGERRISFLAGIQTRLFFQVNNAPYKS